MAHTKLMKRKDTPQGETYLRIRGQNIQRYQIPTQNWRPMPLHKMIFVQSKVPQNPITAKGIVNLAEVPPQPEPLMTCQKSSEELGKCIVLDVKEGHLEGKCKGITPLVANMIVDKLIESTLESILEETPDRSTPEFQATEILSQTSSNAFSPHLFRPLMMTMMKRLQAFSPIVQRDRAAIVMETICL